MVTGIAKVRNEAHIISDTLDNWAPICDGGIHVYDDCSNDDTPDLCRRHSAVKEVLQSTLFDPDRERAEWFNRQAVLASAQRFMGPRDWVVYFDADEHLWDFDRSILDRPGVNLVAFRSFDAYIAPEDAHLPDRSYAERRWVGPEYEVCHYFYRNLLAPRFHLPDQRHMSVDPRRGDTHAHVVDRILHWGAAISVDAWERKCDYYAEVFGPKYATKWANRRGKAVQTDMKSRYGNPLVLWEDVRAGKAETMPRRGLPFVK